MGKFIDSPKKDNKIFLKNMIKKAKIDFFQFFRNTAFSYRESSEAKLKPKLYTCSDFFGQIVIFMLLASKTFQSKVTKCATNFDSSRCSDSYFSVTSDFISSKTTSNESLNLVESNWNETSFVLFLTSYYP